ncbi:restriction endonuclease subunit S [Stutzerimonas chloritidismutans]|uniref:restriction endonuclease subunit S n=1 Tax=Stutzerimonas chloritidismutans TaxID=203192 RepID=UPI00384B763E
MRIDPAIEGKYGRTRLKGGEVLLTVVGSVGQVAVAPKTVSGFNVARAVAVIHPEDHVEPEWIALCLRSPLSQHLLGSRANTTVQTTINLKDLRALPIPLPPARERREIASVMSALDDRITLLRETNATLEAIAQALFNSWFVDFDPVRAKAEGRQPEGMDATTAALFPDSFEESEQGLVPEGWRMSTLGAICDANGGAIQTGPFGSQLHASDYVADGVPVVMPKDISNRRIDAITAARVGREDVQRLARHQLRDGDIVFSRRGDVEKHALIGEAERGWLCGTGCLLVRPGSRRNVAGFLSRSLDLPNIKKWLTQHAVGATMPNLNTGILSAVPVVLPTDEVLTAFDQAISVLDRRISAGNAAAQTLTQLRDTLLPRLISGQLRLPATTECKDAE